MSIVMELNPFEFFVDANGTALDNGSIWIGEVNKDPRNYPVIVFYDAALTIPAPMPLRTSNGYIARRGTPSFLYIDGNYSIMVLDKKGRQVYYVPDFLMIGNGKAVSQEQFDGLANTSDIAKGDALIGVKQPYPGAVSRNQHETNAERTSVRDFGGIGDGMADDTLAFGIAARGIPAFMDMTGPKDAATRPESVRIRVPYGTWRITDYPDCNYRFPIWELDQGAKLVGNSAQFLPGTIMRPGQRLHSYTCSTMDPATTFNVKGNNPYPESGAEVTGISSDQALSLVKERASVALYIENRGYPPLFTLTLTSYTSISVTFAQPVDKRRIIKGMIIDTAHTPDKYSGAISSVSADGKTIFVTGWYLSNGVLSGATTPPNTGAVAYVNPANKIWAQNTNGFLFPESFSDEIAVNETGLFNYRSNFIPGVGSAFTGPRSWGFDSVNLGTFQSEAGYIQRGNFHYGFYGNAITSNFRSSGVGSALTSDSISPIQIRISPGFDTVYQVSNNGSIEAGSLTVASTPTYDFHSSGNSNDYDVRLIASGGGVPVGTGLLTFNGGGFAFGGQIRPSADNTINCGTPSFRFNTYYGVNGAINTSDARDKTVPENLTDSEISAAREISKEVKTFKWLDRIRDKGIKDARTHIGMTVQRVIEIMQKHDLEPFKYGFICYDEWDEQVIEHPAVHEKVPVYDRPKPYIRDGWPVFNDDGDQVFQPPEVKDYKDGVLITAAWSETTMSAGNRFSLRHDQLALFCIAGLYADLEDRLSKLENSQIES